MLHPLSRQIGIPHYPERFKVYVSAAVCSYKSSISKYE